MRILSAILLLVGGPVISGCRQPVPLPAPFSAYPDTTSHPYLTPGALDTAQAGHYNTYGQVHHAYVCPPCPPSAMCEPCSPPHFQIAPEAGDDETSFLTLHHDASHALNVGASYWFTVEVMPQDAPTRMYPTHLLRGYTPSDRASTDSRF